jgi:hypothetical protein
MNASDIIRLLNTNHYAPADLDEVNKLCRNFPEFSTAHQLKVRIMEALGYEKKQQLKVAAIYSMNRKKLLQLVSEVKQASEPEPEPEPVDEIGDIIQFSEESNEHADVIIEHHAPYAGQESGSDLLELDEDPEEELLEILEEESDGPPVEDSIEEATELPAEDSTEESVEEAKPEKSGNHLITSFIRGELGPIRADKETSLKGDVSLASIREHDGFITDTLAQIYVKQGLYAKAIYAYEKLSLKYPEKSAYFAAQIEKIRNINHS